MHVGCQSQAYVHCQGLRGFFSKFTNLAGARLGQIADEVDLLGRGEGTDDLAHLKRELLDERHLLVLVVLEFPREGKAETRTHRQIRSAHLQ